MIGSCDLTSRTNKSNILPKPPLKLSRLEKDVGSGATEAVGFAPKMDVPPLLLLLVFVPPKGKPPAGAAGGAPPKENPPLGAEEVAPKVNPDVGAEDVPLEGKPPADAEVVAGVPNKNPLEADPAVDEMLEENPVAGAGVADGCPATAAPVAVPPLKLKPPMVPDA